MNGNQIPMGPRGPQRPPGRGGPARRPLPPGMAMPRGYGVGDEPGRAFDPEQRRYDIEEKSKYLPDIGVPTYPAQPSTQEMVDRLKEIGLTIPGLNLVVDAFCRCIIDRIECIPINVKNPSWLEPPVSSLPIDLFDKKQICPSSPPGALNTILDFTGPERLVTIILKFANEIEDVQLLGLVKWSILVSGATVSRFYKDFTLSLGTIQEPTAFGAPIIVQPNQRIQVVASIGGVDCTNVFARMIGFMFPIAENTFDGKWPAFCQAH